MGKAPAFQFYPGDWIQDTRILTPLTRGIWIDMLCFMWRSSDRGKLEGTPGQLARMLSCEKHEIEIAVQELSVTKIADVTQRNDFVTVINRRMFREEKIRKQTRSRVEKFRNADVKRDSNGPVTHASSSSSSCTKVHIKTKAQAPIVLPDWIPQETWIAFLEMRKSIRKPATQKAQQLIISDLTKFKTMGYDPIVILEKSIKNSWQDVYEPKDGGGNGRVKIQPDDWHCKLCGRKSSALSQGICPDCMDSKVAQLGASLVKGM